MHGLKFIPNWFPSLSGAIAPEVGESVAVNDSRQVGWFTKYNGVVDGGTINIVWAPEKDYAGAWSIIATIDCADLVTGEDGSGTWPTPMGHIRAEIPTGGDITGGGSVDVLFNSLLG